MTDGRAPMPLSKVIRLVAPDGSTDAVWGAVLRQDERKVFVINHHERVNMAWRVEWGGVTYDVYAVEHERTGRRMRILADSPAA